MIDAHTQFTRCPTRQIPTTPLFTTASVTAIRVEAVYTPRTQHHAKTNAQMQYGLLWIVSLYL